MGVEGSTTYNPELTHQFDNTNSLEFSILKYLSKITYKMRWISDTAINNKFEPLNILINVIKLFIILTVQLIWKWYLIPDWDYWIATPLTPAWSGPHRTCICRAFCFLNSRTLVLELCRKAMIHTTKMIFFFSVKKPTSRLRPWFGYKSL